MPIELAGWVANYDYLTDRWNWIFPDGEPKPGEQLKFDFVEKHEKTKYYPDGEVSPF